MAVRSANGGRFAVRQIQPGSYAAINPLRYRGYYYDSKTGFYYLQSRYYDPIVKCFLNADSYGSTGQGFLGFNMFAYCGNNPVNTGDPGGHRPVNVCSMLTDSGGAPSWYRGLADFVQSWQNWNCSYAEAYERYYNCSVSSYIWQNITYWHYEGREERNQPYPSYEEASSYFSKWERLSVSQSIYHDNGIGKNEEKFIHPDGREAVFDGDTHLPITDPRFIATYNYVVIHTIPDEGATVWDYLGFAVTGVGHFLADMLPYYILGNTR